MKVRRRGLAGVPETRNYRPTRDAVVQRNFYAPSLQMSIRDIAVRSDTKNDVIADDIIERDFLGQDAGRIFRYSIQHLRNLAVGNGQNRLAVAPPAFVRAGSVVMGITVRAHLDPIGRKPLRIVDLSVDRNETATVIGIICRAITRQPNAPAEGRAENDRRVATHGNPEIFDCGIGGSALRSRRRGTASKYHPMT